jgi:hypothetical protein
LICVEDARRGTCHPVRVPRFHLHLHDRGGVIHDPEGADFPDLAAAQRAAIAALRDVIASDVRGGMLDLRGSIAICDDRHAVVLTVRARDAVTLVTDD